MPEVAIVVATQYGQTLKIAKHLGEQFRHRGWGCRQFNLRDDQAVLPIDWKDYDAIIIGAPIYAGHYPQRILNWVWHNVEILNSKRPAFFSVTLNAADPLPAARIEDKRLLDEFQEITGLRPCLTASFAGALHYRKYDFAKRILMQGISAKHGGPTDVSRNHEMTDWAQVDGFVRDFVAAATLVSAR